MDRRSQVPRNTRRARALPLALPWHDPHHREVLFTGALAPTSSAASSFARRPDLAFPGCSRSRRRAAIRDTLFRLRQAFRRAVMVRTPSVSMAVALGRQRPTQVADILAEQSRSRADPPTHRRLRPDRARSDTVELDMTSTRPSSTSSPWGGRTAARHGPRESLRADPIRAAPERYGGRRTRSLRSHSPSSRWRPYPSNEIGPGLRRGASKMRRILRHTTPLLGHPSPSRWRTAAANMVG